MTMKMPSLLTTTAGYHRVWIVGILDRFLLLASWYPEYRSGGGGVAVTTRLFKTDSVVFNNIKLTWLDLQTWTHQGRPIIDFGNSQNILNLRMHILFFGQNLNYSCGQLQLKCCVWMIVVLLCYSDMASDVNSVWVFGVTQIKVIILLLLCNGQKFWSVLCLPSGIVSSFCCSCSQFWRNYYKGRLGFLLFFQKLINQIRILRLLLRGWKLMSHWGVCCWLLSFSLGADIHIDTCGKNPYFTTFW